MKKNVARSDEHRPLREVLAAPPPSSALDDGKFRRVSFALDMLTAPHAPYSTAERFIVLTVVRAMSLKRGLWDCFLSHDKLATWPGAGTRTIRRLLDKHCNGPAPLLKRTTPRF